MSMADHKRNMVSSDEQKASSIAPEVAPGVKTETKKKIRKAPKVKKQRKKGMPIVVDILVVCVFLAVLVGSGWGLYKVTEYFSTRYAPMDITYTLLASDVSAELAFDEDGKCVVLPDSDVYALQDGQSVPVGQVLSVSTEQQDDGTVDVYVVVETNADYNYALGYFVNQVKIAVGKTYECRFSGLVSDAVIVELQVVDEEA